MDQEIDKKLESRQIKPTAMRQLVLSLLTEQRAAISLPELEKKFEKADKTTLYRTLKTFEEKKLIHSIDDGSGSVKYALCLEKCECQHDDLHVHFMCLSCKHTYCLNDMSVPSFDLPRGFQLNTVNLVVKGVCPNCNY